MDGGGAFSTFRRVFGERVTSPKRENVIQGMRPEAAPYSRRGDESVSRGRKGGVSYGMRVRPPHGRSWADMLARSRQSCQI